MAKCIAQNDHQSYLVWLDLEMTGLDREWDTIIEIAALVTTNALIPVDQGVSYVVHHDQHILKGMSQSVMTMHTVSGLIERSLQSSITLDQAGHYVASYVASWCKKNESPLCGNSVWQDRLFLQKYLPQLEQFFHYRVIDVSSIKELVYRWYPEKSAGIPVKKKQHRALEDIVESIEELRYYRSNFFV